MTNQKDETSPLIYARVAGIFYLMMVPLGFFAMYGHTSVMAYGDAATTASNLISSASMFRLAIASALSLQLVNIILVLFLYKLLKHVNKNLVTLMVIFIMAAVPIAMITELFQVAALLLLSGADYLAVFTTEQLHAQVLFLLELHEYGIRIAFIFWGLWLFPMGYLVFKSGFLPRILGILLILGGFGYLIDAITFFLFPHFEQPVDYKWWGEVGILSWLLIKGVNVEQWEKVRLNQSNKTDAE